MSGDPYEVLDERRNISTEEMVDYFTALDEASKRAEARERRYKNWHKKYDAAARDAATRPPTEDEMASLPFSKKHYYPKWHRGGTEDCPAPGDRVSVWIGPYTSVKLPALDLARRWADRGCWRPMEAHRHDWSKPCLYRVFKTT